MNFIVLTNQSRTIRKAFKVLGNDYYRPSESKLATERVTITGKLDFQFGTISKVWNYTLKVSGSTSETVTHQFGGVTVTTDEGNFSDLRTFFRYNTPGDNLLTLIDVDETEHDVYITNALEEEPINNQVTGADAYFRVPITLKRATAIA